MKLKMLYFLFASGFLHSYGQVDKFSAGDIGIRYQLNYTGALQNQVTVSGFVLKRLEIGGTVSLTYNRVAIMYKTNDSIFTQNNAWNYTLGFDPYLVYHFPMKSKQKKSKFDFYIGGFAWFSISNSNNNNSTWNSNGDFLTINSSGVTLSPVYSIGGGWMVGCQYFLSKHMAIGIQGGQYYCAAFTNSNNYLYQQNGIAISTDTPVNTKQKGVQVGGFVGISVSYYITTKKARNSADQPAGK